MQSRFDYVKYDNPSMVDQEEAKDLCRKLEHLILGFPQGRATALALTKLEEAYMWIGKAIRDAQITRNGAAELQEERKNDPPYEMPEG